MVTLCRDTTCLAFSISPSLTQVYHLRASKQVLFGLISTGHLLKNSQKGRALVHAVQPSYGELKHAMLRTETLSEHFTCKDSGLSQIFKFIVSTSRETFLKI